MAEDEEDEDDEEDGPMERTGSFVADSYEQEALKRSPIFLIAAVLVGLVVVGVVVVAILTMTR